MVRPAPYSHQHIHCAHCEPCTTPDCLKDENTCRKCRSAMRRDDLKKHTLSQHAGKMPMATSDRKQPKIHTIFTSKGNSSSFSNPSETQAEDALTPLFEPFPETNESRPFELSQENTINTTKPSKTTDNIVEFSSPLSVIKKVNTRLDSVEETLSKIVESMRISKSEHNDESSCNNVSDISDIDLKMSPCRSIIHIETFFPCQKYYPENNYFECMTCKQYTAKSKVTVFKYEDVNGIDFTNVKAIPRVFRNLKQTLRDHLRDSDIHQNASEYVRKEEVLLKLQKKKALSARMTLGRLAYSILYRGAPYTHFTKDVLVTAKVGD